MSKTHGIDYMHFFLHGNHRRESGKILGATVAYLQAEDLLVGGVAYCSALEPGFSRKEGRNKALDALISQPKDSGLLLPKSFILPARVSRRDNRDQILRWLFHRVSTYVAEFSAWVNNLPSLLKEDRDHYEADILLMALTTRFSRRHVPMEIKYEDSPRICE